MAHQLYDKKTPLILSIFAITVTICFAFYHHIKTYNIAYVRIMELVYGYNGMKEARADYKTQTDIWQSNVDTLRMQYQRCVSEYQSDLSKLSDKERVEKQVLIEKLETNLRNYSSVIKQKAQEKEKEMTESVLNQINSYVEAYGKRKGYDFVIGSNNGTLIYANNAFDITEEVLEAINNEHKIISTKKNDPSHK